MPNAVQTLAGFATAAGAGTLTVTPSPPDILAVPSFNVSSKGYIEKVAVSGTTVDFARIRSPRMHDANQGLRLQVGGTLRRDLLPVSLQEQVYPADTPIIELDATGAATNGILFSYAFDDLPGAQPVLQTWEAVAPRIIHTMGCQVTATSGAIGTWGAAAALNSTFDNFEAGAWYALLGYTCGTACLGMRVTGKDTGNLGIGGPGSTDPLETRNYFVIWDRTVTQPRIPLIQANNKASTFIQTVDVAAATVSAFTLYLAQLSG